jgi:hypothetical protein
MIFTNTNLIDQATLTRATRQMVSDVLPAADASSLGRALDREQILSTLALALADLDASDPLDAIRTVDVAAYLGREDPLVKVSTRHYGTLVTAVYLGELNEANQVPFDAADDCQVRLHAQVDQPVLHAVIRWPRQAAPIPLSDRPTTLPSFVEVRCVLAAGGTDPRRIFDTDGVTLAIGERCLACLGKDSAAPGNGIYVATAQNFVRAPDACVVGDFPVGKVVRVTDGGSYGDTVWQVVTAPIGVGTSPIDFQLLTYPTNVDANQAHAHVIPRAAAYLALQVAAALGDKALAQKLNEWSTAILSRPLPAHADAISRRVQTGSTYASS